MILLHGNFASPRWWEPVRGHLPGDVPVLADQLTRLIQTQDLQQPVAVGHSLGGVVATQFALDHIPD